MSAVAELEVQVDALSEEACIDRIDALHAEIAQRQREVFRLLVQLDRREHWEDFGSHDTAHYLSMRYDISYWKADRWIKAAHALERLPLLSKVFSSGELGVDKVVELARFATPQTERRLVMWAREATTGAIRRKGDLANRPSTDDAEAAENDRSLTWEYFDDGKRFGLEAQLSAADGAVVEKALKRLADTLPVMPGEEEPLHVDARRADALVMMCSSRIANDADPDRATVVIHARAGAFGMEAGAADIEDGPVISDSAASRLMCSARIQGVLEDASGDPVKLGRLTREPPRWMMRQLKFRDRECRFPGCGARRFLQAHHIVWWEDGGTTDLDNLILSCFFHHKLVHEYGWRVTRDAAGAVEWFRPTGIRHSARKRALVGISAADP